MSQSGVPLDQIVENKETIQKYMSDFPKEWLDGAEFSYEQLVNHITESIISDPKIANALKEKRLQNLMKNITEDHYPNIIKCINELKQKPDNTQKVTKIKNDDLGEVAFVEPKNDEVMVHMEPISKDDDNEPKLTAPYTIKALNLAYISRLQRENPKTRRIIDHLTQCPKEKQDSKLKKNFKLLNFLLVTRKSPKLPWEPSNIRIYLSCAQNLMVAGINSKL